MGDKKLGIIILSRHWFSEDADGLKKVQIKENIENETIEKQCYQVNGYPVIGITEDNAFNNIGQNSKLIEAMFNHLNGNFGINEMFLALHDKQFGVNGTKDISGNAGYSFILEILNAKKTIKKAIFFQHIESKNPNDILASYKQTKNIEKFYRDIEKYILEDTICKANALRSEILTPLIPFHLYFQIKNPGNEWGSILKESADAIKINIGDSKIEKFLALLEDKGLKNEIKANCKKVQNYIDNGIDKCNKDTCKKAIENFAASLEKAISFIEGGKAT